MSPSRVTISLALLCVLVIALVCPAFAAGESLPRFEPVSCQEFGLADYAPGAVEGSDIECGYLVVPEVHAQPEGGTIQLGVLIIRSTGSHPASEPLILTQGGPGGSGIDLFANLADPDNDLGRLLRQDRDLIVFEQRGTLFSDPFLFCQEVFDLELETMDQDLSDEEELRQTRQAFSACRDRLHDQGIDLAAFNSIENALDVADLAEALGYGQINFYGVSYGTMLGQHLMRLKPDLLRAAVLDGVVPLDLNPNQEMPVAMNRGLSQLFDACAGEKECSAAYPDLEGVFFDTVESLNRSPVSIPLSDPETGITYQALVDGDDLVDFTTQMLYVNGAVSILPRLIYDARDGVFTVHSVFMKLLGFDRTQAEGMYLSVMCAEDYDYQLEGLNLAGVRDELAEMDVRDTQAILQICADWDVPELGPAADEPLVTDVPVLLLSGRFDPVTPPAYADRVAQTLGHAVNLTFPANGHGAFLEDECATNIVRDFLEDPYTKPDAACIQETAQVVFATPSNRLMSRGAVFLLDLTERVFASSGPEVFLQSAAVLALPALLVLGMMLFPIVWFVGWLVHRLRGLRWERRWLAYLAPLLGVAAPVIAFLFTVLNVVVVFFSLSSDLPGYVGLDRAYAWVFTLPLLFAAVSQVMAVLAILSWVRGYWGRPARVYYSFTTLLALGYTLVLAHLGLLVVLFA